MFLTAISSPPGYPASTPGTSCRESNDLDGKADLEKGVVDDVRLAEVLVAPSVETANVPFMLTGRSSAVGR